MKKLFLIIPFIVVVGGFLFYVSNKKSSKLLAPVASTPNPQIDQFIMKTPDTTQLLAGGSSFRDQSNYYTLLYPNDYVLDTKDPLHTRIYKRGDTQKGQTEMYDGVILTFEVVNLGDQNLSDYVNNRVSEMSRDGTSQVTTPKETALKSYSGFQFDVNSLGTATYLIIQKDQSSKYALLITSLVSDPNNVGYQSEVDSTLYTLDLSK